MKLDEFRKLMEASTPGPWVYDSYSSVVGAYPGYDPHVLASVPVIAGDTATPDGANDAAFIAAMRSMAPKLLAVAGLLEEFANGKLDLGELTAPTARAAALEHMFYVMRQKAREALSALEEETP